MPQDTPDLFAVNGGGVHVTYASTGIAGQPDFTYQDAQRMLSFDGDQISRPETELGTIITVPIEKTIDAGFTSFSLLVPRVRLVNGQSAHITTTGITALHRGTVDTPLLGRLDTFHTIRLHGTAAFVEFEMAPQTRPRRLKRLTKRSIGQVESLGDKVILQRLPQPARCTMESSAPIYRQGYRALSRRPSWRSLLGADSQMFVSGISATRRPGRPVRDGLRVDCRIIGLRSALLLALVVATAALSACGSSDTSSSASTASTSSTTTPTTAGSGSGLAAAKQECLDATKNIPDSRARSTAEQACGQITTNNANVTSALGNAKQACLSAAAMIPIASFKQTAETQCNKIPAQ